jgi:hypothetical protein
MNEGGPSDSSFNLMAKGANRTNPVRILKATRFPLRQRRLTAFSAYHSGIAYISRNSRELF